MLTTAQELAQKFFKLEPLIVGPGIKTGMPILYESPKDVGADRIVNGIAAYEKYHDSCIVVDFGTATTIDLISKKGEYVGGAIAPGLSISLEALVQRASKLPRIEIVKPKEVVGTQHRQLDSSGDFLRLRRPGRRHRAAHSKRKRRPSQGRSHRRAWRPWWLRSAPASARWTNF